MQRKQLHSPDPRSYTEYVVRFLRPYTQTWGEQTFSTESEATRMLVFYQSCGSPAQLITK